MASFNGVDMGAFVSMRVVPNPNEIQKTAYPAVDGVSALNMGSRGKTTEADFEIYADDVPAVRVIEIVWWKMLEKATIGLLIDTANSNWKNVYIETLIPGELGFIPGYGWARSYKAIFSHLTAT